MAGGALDPNGVWLYGEDDQRDTFSALLNIGQDATSDAIGSDRARLAALEAAGSTSATGTPLTVATGWALGTNVGRKRNGIAFLSLLFTRTGAAITVAGDGNFANVLLATVNVGWQKAAGVNASLIHDGFTGPLVSGFLNAANEAQLGAIAPGAVINTTTTIGFNAVSLLA